MSAAEEISNAPETVEEMAGHSEAPENETEASGGYREPHPDEPAEAATTEESFRPNAETPAEISRAPEVERERRPEPARPKPWVKPADFRPAEISAISQAVAHATEIAESLKHTIDQLDEILELVELAERQKIADEREIDELRRALRRIQPPRHQPQPQRGPRREEPRHGRHDSRENVLRPEEPPRPPEAEEPPAQTD
jgi:hypothetical protein